MAGGASWRFGLAMVVWSFLMTVAPVNAVLPDAPEQCDASGCSLNNAYGLWNDRIPCKAAKVLYPQTESEIISAVASATQAHQKIKVSTAYSHSVPKLACPGSPSGLIISSRNYNRVLHIDTDLSTITVQSGITWRALQDQAAQANLALNVSPYFDGVTLGGSLGTSVHGSSLWGLGGAVHEYVIGMRIVTPGNASQGYAQVREITSLDPDLNAVKVHLGVLGVISTVTLQAEPMFKRKVEMVRVKGDEEFSGEKVRAFAKRFQYAEVIWYLGLREVVYKQDERVAVNVTGDGRNDYLGLMSTPEASVELISTNDELADYFSCRDCKCALARAQVTYGQSVSYGYKKQSTSPVLPSPNPFAQFPVIGFQNDIQNAGGCQRDPGPYVACSWEPRINALVYFEDGGAIPLRYIEAFIDDIKALRMQAPNGSLCALDIYTGILFRFTKQTRAYMGTAQEDDAVMVDFAWSRSKSDDKAGKARLDTDVFQEIEQLVFDKYGGRPHWGKNRNVAFDGVWRKFPKLGEFLEVKERFDPEGLFSSAWSDAILGIGGSPVSDGEGCAVEGNCKCSRDEHCAEGMKYNVCTSGLFYKDARVCR